MHTKFSIVLLALFCGAISTNAQTLKDLLKKKTSDTTQKTNTISTIFKKITAPDSVSTNDVENGLKQALEIGAQKSADKLSVTDGFFKNAAIKILLPPEAKQVEKTLRSLGMGKLVDDALLSMNRAAEDAAKSAAPIFINAVKGMTLQDAWGILKGTDTAATAYMRGKTTPALTEAFRPVIESSIQKTNATKYWNTVFTSYNKVARQKINPDLSAYVTEKALAGIFMQLGEEEKKIRKDPAAQTTALLKKVFGKQ
ncbi:MAG TPA: DUF4197 domain-containing protein [Phnomibacter sp.]|nr:DUF4197 domain-containing protein [Phnomibacter sp.]